MQIAHMRIMLHVLLDDSLCFIRAALVYHQHVEARRRLAGDTLNGAANRVRPVTRADHHRRGKRCTCWQRLVLWSSWCLQHVILSHPPLSPFFLAYTAPQVLPGIWRSLMQRCIVRLSRMTLDRQSSMRHGAIKGERG